MPTTQQYLTNAVELSSVADAIRQKGGTSSPLEYPDGFIDAIEDISTQPNLQAKTVTPTTAQQVVTPSSGYDGFSQVTVNAMPQGSATTPATTINASPNISVDSAGLITATVLAGANFAPSVSPGYVSQGTAGFVQASGTNTKQLPAQAAQTITPTTQDQTILAGTYLTGAQTIQGDADLIPANIKKDVNIFGVTGTYEGSGGGPYTVTITLYNPISRTYFNKFEIYEWDLVNDQIGQKIGEITSATGSATVTPSTNAIWCKLFGGYVIPPSSVLDVMCSQGIGYCNRSNGSDGDAYMSFIIGIDGDIDITSIDWDE